MENPNTSHHRGMLTNALKANSAWKLAAGVLAIVAVILAWGMLKMKTAQTVTIAPYGLYSANKSVTVGKTIAQNKDYLNLLFQADIGMLLNWQAKTVGSQFESFMTRLSPSGYKSYNLDLRNKANRYKEQNMSQSFYLENIDMLTSEGVDKVTMQAKGKLIRWRGDEELINEDIVYRLTYSQTVLGVFQVDKIEASYEKTNAKQAPEV